MKTCIIQYAIPAWVLITASVVQAAVPGLINYQGRLTNASGQPISTPVDVTFTFWDAETGGAQLGAGFSDTDTVTPGTDGIYSTLIGDDPVNLVPVGIFDAVEVWLNVRINGEDLTPRKRIVSVGYALRTLYADTAVTSTRALSAARADDADALGGRSPGSFANAAHNHATADIVSGMFEDAILTDTLTISPAGAVDGGAIKSGTVAAARIDNAIARDSEIMPAVLAGDGPGSGLNADLLDGLSSEAYAAVAHQHDALYWRLGGNTGTTPGTQFLGTTDNTTLTLAINGTPGLRLVPPAFPPSLIGGYSGNSVTGGVLGATVCGGGTSGLVNRVTDNFGVVTGGYNNQAGDNAGRIDDAPYAFVGGGGSNTAGSWFAAVGGGWANTAGGDNATVGGGHSNTAGGDHTTIGGGANNVASATRGTIAGGGYLADAAYGNRVTDEGGFVGGGANNQAGDNAGVETDAYYAAVAGGWSNTAGNKYAFVGGGDTNTASGTYAVVPGGRLNDAAGNYSFAAGNRAKANNQGCFVWGDANNADISCNNDNRWMVRAGGGVYFYTNSALSSGAYLASDGSSWNVVSNRSLKENFQPVDRQELLARLSDMEITSWNYKAQDPAIRHVGPMAGEFNALIEGLGGEGQGTINSLDTDGVALAAIQGLYDLAQQQQARIAELEARLAELEAKR